MSVPVPGDNHPAVAHYAALLAEYDKPTVSVAVPPVATFDPEPEPYASLPLVLDFTVSKAAQTLYPEYGTYVWRVWTDQYGRHVTESKAEWVPNPMAWIHEEWNPPKRPQRTVTIHSPE